MVRAGCGRGAGFQPAFVSFRRLCTRNPSGVGGLKTRASTAPRRRETSAPRRCETSALRRKIIPVDSRSDRLTHYLLLLLDLS